MNQLLFYLIQVIAASGLLYGYYHFALRNKKFHRYNRFYLLMAVAISSLIPFLNIPVYFSENEIGSSAIIQTLQVISSPASNEAASTVLYTEAATSSWFTREEMIYLFYFLVLSFFVVRVFISLNKIRFIIKRNPAEQIDKIQFVNTDEPGTPFSFFRWLFWNRKIELHSEKGEQIFRHELFHIQQKHSWDIIFMEFISTIFWINPFFHLIKKEVKAIHEFLADEFAVKENKNWQYAELLLMQVLNTNTHLVNPFFHNQIKRRIAMITSSKKPSYQYLRKLMVFPVAAIIVTLFAFNYQNRQKIDPHEFEKSINSITVVIDAGHGGTDAGAKTKDGKYNEAELSLAIAKKIEALGPEYNVNVIMTRIDEKFPGGATNKKDALKERVELVNNLNPHAFVAIHLNTTTDSKQVSRSGFDAYVTKRQYNELDIQLASSVLDELKKIYTTTEEIRHRGNASIYVIDEANSPSLLLECGFINNPKDISFITNEKNQEKIARAILKGLVTFSNKSPRTNSLKIPSDTTPDVSKMYKNALVVINGKIQTKRGFDAIDTTLFKGNFKGSIRISKDASLIDKYGEKGKDGVIEIKTEPEQSIIFMSPETGTLPTVKVYQVSDLPAPGKRSPTQSQLNDWKDAKMYGVWIDGKRIDNAQLKNYNSSDFSHYFISKLSKNAVNYGKHYYQLDLMTNKYYENYLTNFDYNKQIKFIRLVPQDTVPKVLRKYEDYLIIIDGEIKDKASLEKVIADSIESITILKDKTAIDKYGDKAKNGVIEIKTKKPVVIKEVTLQELKGTIIKPANDTDNIVFEKVQIEASYPGGVKAWGNFLTTNLDPNVPVKNGCKPGTYTVVIKFIVGRDSSIKDVIALT